MPDLPRFEDKASEFALIAAKIARAHNEEPEATVLENSTATLMVTGYDSDGTPYYTMTLEVPIQTYVSIEQGRGSVEQRIQNRIREIVRRYPDRSISEVIVTPVLPQPAPAIAPPPGVAPEPPELPSLWGAGSFRLFISHTSASKSSAHNLKSGLAKYPIAAFVAHDDIEPTKEWEAEIERALRTADAFAAIITPDFVQSRWCDQEVGFAFGRGKLVVPLCKDSVPHGFLGKYQGFNAKGLSTADVADQLFQILRQHPLSAERIIDSLVENVATAISFQAARNAMDLLEKIPRLTQAQVTRLLQSINENDQVGKAIRVPERINALISRSA